MKTRHPPFYGLGLIAVLLLSPSFLVAISLPGDSSCLFKYWLPATETAFNTVRQAYWETAKPKRLRLGELNLALNSPAAQIPEFGYPLLLEKALLEGQLQKLDSKEELELLRLRYRKGIEMLKILYEKILSMDHHFTSLRTNHRVLRISNPHEYPEFKALNNLVEERLSKKSHFTLPAIMEGNPYLSAMYSLAGLAFGGGNKMDKTQLEQLSCILDFTVRMHQDLNVVYYETEYLCDANLTLKRECELLFADCAGQVGYTAPLSICRNKDDWEELYGLLDNYVNLALNSDNTIEVHQKKAYANLQFAVDRIVHFLEKYCAFVNQGNVYYKKFARIITGYSNEKVCMNTLPDTFNRLKSDIEITLMKFNSAYTLPEIQGSRLKDLLYGIGD